MNFWNNVSPERKQQYLWIGGGVLVALVVVGALWLSGVSQIAPGGRGGLVETPKGSLTELGTSPVLGGRVVAADGTSVREDVEAGTPGAPVQSKEIPPSEIPSAALSLSVSEQGFAPRSFSVAAGTPVHLAVTATDDQAHLFAFKNPALSAVVVGVGPHQSRVISFNAPREKGDYAFQCGVPGHTEKGVMTVK